MPRIDGHQHLIPPGYAGTLARRSNTASGEREFPGWSVNDAQRFTDEMNIKQAILSAQALGVWTGEVITATELAHRVNDFAGRLARRTGRFGFFASVPLPDVDAACTEAVRVLDGPGATGLVVLANNGGTYLGDPGAGPGLPAFAVGFLLDATRASVNLALRNVPARYPKVRFILAHAGGFPRCAGHQIAALNDAHLFQAGIVQQQRTTAEILAFISRFCSDTALSGSPAVLPACSRSPTPRTCCPGSNFPDAPPAAIQHFQQETGGLPVDAGVRAAIDATNARGLLAPITPRGGNDDRHDPC